MCQQSLDGLFPAVSATVPVGGDQIEVGAVEDAQGVAVGRGAQAVRVGDVSGTLIQAHGLVQSSIFTAGTITIQQQAEAGADRRPSIWQVLPPSDYYVSRPEFEDRLLELLKTPTQGLNVVGLYGLPGVGCSLMGRKVALELKKEFPDGALWVDIEARSEIDVLWSLIEPYQAPAERSPLRDYRYYLADLERILEHKRVLIVFNQVSPENGELVNRVLPRGSAGSAVLLIASAPLPGLFRESNSVCLQELTPEEAEHLFRNIWRGSFRATSSEVVRSLAGELGYLPTQIILVARDIINRQIAPQDYLEELRRNKAENQLHVTMDHPGLQTVYENLPPRAKQVFPFIGIVGYRGWTLEDLVTVSQLKRQEVDTGLRQLVLAGFLKGDLDGGFRCSPGVCNYALSLMREMGGEELVQISRAVMARHILRQARDTSRLFRQTIMDDFLDSKERQRQFTSALDEAFLPASVRGRPGDSVPLRSRPGLTELDIIQDVFERVVLATPKYYDRWTELLASKLCQRQRMLLEDALVWAIQKEDWSLVRRFATLSMSASDSDFGHHFDGSAEGTISVGGFSFGPLRGCKFSGGQLDTDFQAVRLIDPHFENCELVSTCWEGVHLYRPQFINVDMVNAYMPGLVVRDGTLIDVDARGADFRGAIFYNCYLESFNFRYADISAADFIHCRGGKIDLRNTNLRGTTFVGTTFTEVTYYEADQSVFKPLVDSSHPTGPIKGQS
jgi:hypothetical protein